jgi:hypothetical protein
VRERFCGHGPSVSAFDICLRTAETLANAVHVRACA